MTTPSNNDEMVNGPRIFRALRWTATLAGIAMAIGMWTTIITQVEDDDQGAGESYPTLLSTDDVSAPRDEEPRREVLPRPRPRLTIAARR